MKLLIPADEIRHKIEEVASKLDVVYAGSELTIVMVMKGALCLTADLIRALQIPCRIEWVEAKSYGSRGTERGALSIAGLETCLVQGKHILLVDDIYDSGHTLHTIKQRLEEKQPASIRSLVLLSKRISRDISYEPDYVLFSIDNHFVVGYGLDYKELYRGLSGVYAINN